MAQANSTVTSERELSITRWFDAPRALVFEAWTDPVHLGRWSGPEGFTFKPDYFDASPGGTYRFCLRDPGGTEHWLRGVYREVVVPERLVFTHAWEDGAGDLSPETVVTITFAEHGRRTLLTLHQAEFTSVSSRDGHADGWSGSLDCLERYLAEAGGPGSSSGG
ncbi:MAG: SRPBCC domain-containing protein [Hyphomicrobiales bacterium]|nr:SRPBCC domain-containing protein [Hyphomicrobiales bacterium]